MKNNVKTIKENTFFADNNEFSVNCILFEEDIEERISEEKDIYGIELQKISANNVLMEKETATGITAKYDFAKYIFDVILKNKVTPVCLYDVIDELISQSEINWNKFYYLIEKLKNLLAIWNVMCYYIKVCFRCSV